MTADKIIEEKQEKEPKKKDNEDKKEFHKAIDETDIAIFKRYSLF